MDEEEDTSSHLDLPKGKNEEKNHRNRFGMHNGHKKMSSRTLEEQPELEEEILHNEIRRSLPKRFDTMPIEEQ